MKNILKNLLILSSVLLNFNLKAYLIKNETGEDIDVLFFSSVQIEAYERNKKLISEQSNEFRKLFEFGYLSSASVYHLANNQYIDFHRWDIGEFCAQKSSQQSKKSIKVTKNPNALCFKTSDYDLENLIFTIAKAEQKTQEELKNEEQHLSLLDQLLSPSLINIISGYAKPTVYDLKISKETEEERLLRLRNERPIYCPTECRRIEGMLPTC